MAYWWVNHKQTFKAEIEGGYIWSPKRNTNGAKNQTYVNLTLTKPGDIVFSYADGKTKSVGVVAALYTELPKPIEFGKSGESWADLGWAVTIDWKILSSPLIPKNHIESIAPLLPEKNSPLRKDGNGNQGCYLASISDELGQFLISLAKENNLNIVTCIENDIEQIQEQKVVDDLNEESIESTEKIQIIKARIGQGKFRINVEKIEKKCRVTGISDKNLLIASHIKPWRHSDNFERLDGNNGFLLSPHIDKLFDQGWITFLDDGKVISSPFLSEEILQLWRINLPVNIGEFNKAQREYLSYHREQIFKSKDKLSSKRRVRTVHHKMPSN